jgi:methionyl-tRNA synthetase
MSKSLGNFLDLEAIKGYCRPAPEGFGLDAFRWYLLTQGPLGATDADFVHAKFVEVYNADLANGIGNAASRVSNMIEKYFAGRAPEASSAHLSGGVSDACRTAEAGLAGFDVVTVLSAGMGITRQVDALINATEPFKLAKDPANMPKVGAILYECAEAIRIAAVLLSPAMPTKMGELLRRLGQEAPDDKGRFSRPLTELCRWGGLKPGTAVVKGEALFPRWDAALPAPSPVA